MSLLNRITYILLIASCLYISQINCGGPTIQTALGTIEGTLEIVNDIDTNRVLKVYQYLGIPFAKPPLGNLRFKKPEPVDVWSGTLEAKTMKSACVQYMASPFPWALGDEDKDKISEDCLYLNIWTPKSASPDNKKAVLYWIYGGGFFMGSNRQDLYDGKTLAALGDIVVVVINYRTGALGFWSDGTEEAPGNVGLWDQLTGLKWVNDNIEAFGGDKSRITIAGESAGSISVGLFSVSPLARGLFARQIMESGSPAYMLAENPDATKERSTKIASKINCVDSDSGLTSAVTQCMRSKNALDLIKAEGRLNPGASRSFLPKYGDEILPKNARQALIDGDFQNNDVFIGNNNNEGSFQITTGNKDLFGFFGEKDPNISRNQAAQILYRIFATSTPNADEIINQYLPSGREVDYVPRHQLTAASGDATLLCPTVFFAEKMAEKNNVYFYLYDHRPSNTPWANWMGVVHFEEVQFVFGMPIRAPSMYESSDERLLSKRMIENWSNFVKNGKPDDSWPLYSKNTPKFRYYTKRETEEGLGPHKDDCDFFRPYYGF